MRALVPLGAAHRSARRPETFEEWVTQRFGRRLYDAFFRSYTQKVWGIPGSEIRSLWAAQRIKNFSLVQAMLTILGLRREHVTTLIEEFRYPRLGPGQMWEAIAEPGRGDGRAGAARAAGRVAIRHRDGRRALVVTRDGDAERWLSVDGVVTSLALGDLVLSLDPAAAAAVRRGGATAFATATSASSR